MYIFSDYLIDMQFNMPQWLMPSAHGLIFCRKELREKVGDKVRFFIGVSQRTRSDFLSQTKHRLFIAVSFVAHGLIFYRSYCVTMTGEVPLLDYVTPIFYPTEVSAHGPTFCRKQLREKIGPIFYRTKNQRTRTDLHSDFCLRSVCAGHN